MSADLAWTALEWPGMEHVVVSGDGNGFRAEGQVVLADDGLASVTYRLLCTTGLAGHQPEDQGRERGRVRRLWIATAGGGTGW